MSKSKTSQPFGIHELYRSSEEPVVDIVAVHGLNGDAFKSWTTDDSNICWLNHPDFLQRYIPNCRILTWGYPANIVSTRGRPSSSDYILQHAQTLIAHLQADRELAHASARPIIFVAHSLGGIVVKRALAYSQIQSLARDAPSAQIFTCTYGIVFFGTPHHGSGKANLLATLQKLSSIAVPKGLVHMESSLVKALRQDSETLQNINDQFAPLMRSFRCMFLWEQCRTDLGYTHEYIVDQTSAAPCLDGVDRSGIAADHRGMCKFSSSDDTGLKVVVAALMRYVEAAGRRVKVRTEQARQFSDARRWMEASELAEGRNNFLGRGSFFVSEGTRNQSEVLRTSQRHL